MKNVVAFPTVVPAAGGRVTTPFGVSLMIVVPVPCTLLLLLKLETRISPGEIAPPDGKLGGTNATP